jgi:hypothetical protein
VLVAAGAASGGSSSSVKSQPSAMQRTRDPARVTFWTTNFAPHFGQAFGSGRSHDTKSHPVFE